LCQRKFHKPVGRNGLPVAFTFVGLYGPTPFFGHCGRGHNRVRPQRSTQVPLNSGLRLV